MQTRSLLVRLLAECFAETLYLWLTVDEMEQVVERNNGIYADAPGVCATHDFCDANMVMDSAFNEILGRSPFDSEADADLWSEAWAIAHSRDFILSGEPS